MCAGAPRSGGEDAGGAHAEEVLGHLCGLAGPRGASGSTRWIEDKKELGCIAIPSFNGVAFVVICIAYNKMSLKIME